MNQARLTGVAPYINAAQSSVAVGVGGGQASQSLIDAVSAALETVLYAQMLVLFAPKAVPAKSHVQASGRLHGCCASRAA
jgi:hypothetical protein